MTRLEEFLPQARRMRVDQYGLVEARSQDASVAGLMHHSAVGHAFAPSVTDGLPPESARAYMIAFRRPVPCTHLRALTDVGVLNEDTDYDGPGRRPESAPD